MDNSTKVIEVDINDVLPNRNQPRLILNEDDDLSLTDSVKQYGVLQPIIVRTIGDKYEIIAGERRYRASVLAGKETVPVIVKNMTDKESAEIALIENVQRKELTPIEEALSYKNILDLGYLTQEQLAEKIGKSQPAIANKIRLLNLSDEVQDALLENKISERHARSLLRLKNKKQQDKMLNKIINERLTVRKTDDEIEKVLLGETNDIESEENNLVIEKGKGEIEMNNEINNMPQFTSFINPEPQAPAVEPQVNVFGAPVADVTPSVEPVPQFDIFANAQPVAPVEEPKVENTFVQPTPVVEPIQAEPQFNIFAEPQAPAAVKPVVSAPVEEPKVENTFEIPKFDIFANAPQPQAEPVVEQPVQPAAPVEEPKVENTFEIPKFDIFANANVAPVADATPSAEPAPVAPQFDIFANEQPATPVQEPENVVAVPEENTTNDNFESTGVPVTAPIQDQMTTAQEVKPEPIIVTDYNKQYDPVMPTAQPVQAEPVAFKEVISAIRECAEKIESYGYKIDVDEFDLTNIYQAIFKIEKM